MCMAGMYASMICEHSIDCMHGLQLEDITWSTLLPFQPHPAPTASNAIVFHLIKLLHCFVPHVHDRHAHMPDHTLLVKVFAVVLGLTSICAGTLSCSAK